MPAVQNSLQEQPVMMNSNESNSALTDLIKAMTEQQAKTNELLEKLTKKLEILPSLSLSIKEPITSLVTNTIEIEDNPSLSTLIPTEELISQVEIQPISQDIPPRNEYHAEVIVESSVDIPSVFARFLESCGDDDLRRSALKVLRVIYS
jgi:hypothetical protein